jgi:hypothetical protein
VSVSGAASGSQGAGGPSFSVTGALTTTTSSTPSGGDDATTDSNPFAADGVFRQWLDQDGGLLKLWLGWAAPLAPVSPATDGATPDSAPLDRVTANQQPDEVVSDLVLAEGVASHRPSAGMVEAPASPFRAEVPPGAPVWQHRTDRPADALLTLAAILPAKYAPKRRLNNPLSRRERLSWR